MEASVEADAVGVNVLRPSLFKVADSLGITPQQVQAVLAAFGTENVLMRSHDDDHDQSLRHFQNHHQINHRQSIGERLIDLSVAAPIARRIVREYPADYLAAWCQWVEDHLDDISRPGGYFFRCIQSGEWPPEPLPAPVITPRPQERPRTATTTTVTPNLPAASVQEQGRKERLQTRQTDESVKAIRDRLTPTQRDEFLQQALRDPENRAAWDRADKVLRRAYSVSMVDDQIRKGRFTND